MDLLKLLLCVMLLLLVQICGSERDFRNDPRDDRKAKLTKKRSSTKSNIIEEEIEPTTINVEHKTKPSNVDKTKININLTPRTKTEISDFINKKNLNKTLNTISRKPEKIIVPHLIEKQKTQIKPDLIPVDLFLKKPIKELKAEVEKENEKIEKQPKIGHENENEKSNNEPTIQKLSETEPNTAKIDRKKPSNKKSQNSKDLIIEDEVIKDDLDKSLGDQCVDKILNLFSTEKQSSAESKEPITEKPAPININNEERMAAPQNEINVEELETNNDSNATIDNKTPQEIFTVNYTTKSNDTLKEQIDTQSTKIEIMINHLPANANSPVSSIVIHNNTYQEVTEPVWYRYPYCYYRYPKYCSAYSNYYSPHYQYSQCLQNPAQFKANTYDNWWSQYYKDYTYNNLDKRTSKTWHNLDVSINHPRISESIRDGSNCYGSQL